MNYKKLFKLRAKGLKYKEIGERLIPKRSKEQVGRYFKKFREMSDEEFEDYWEEYK